MSEQILIGCRLPHGIKLRNPMHEGDRAQDVEIKGMNTSKIIGATYVTTSIDKDFWDAWILMNDKFPALKNGGLFVVQSAAQADDVAKEKTGFEAVNPESHGVKKADKE